MLTCQQYFIGPSKVHVASLSAYYNFISVLTTLSSLEKVESRGGVGNEAAISLIQKFWDSAMAMGPLDDEDDSRRYLNSLIKNHGQFFTLLLLY